MTLTLHYHPLSSFCQKVLIGLYELEVPFEKQLVDLGNEAQRTAFYALWPIGKFPVLCDTTRDLVLPETSIILEYIEQQYAQPGRLIPVASDGAREVRLRDRFFDLYVNMPLGKIVIDTLRPEGQHDPYGVAQAKAQLLTAYDIADGWLRDSLWAAGSEFSMADCAAGPALFFANKVKPFTERWPALGAYFARLEGRPSFARVLHEAQPYLAMFPGRPD